MTDTITAVHPVPVLVRAGRSRRAGWALAETRTPVTLPRVDPADAIPAAPVQVGAGDPTTVPTAVIEGRLFLRVADASGAGASRGLAEVMASGGGAYRTIHVATQLIAGSPASAMTPGVDGGFTPVNDAYADVRGEALPPGASIAEDHTEAAREALRLFVSHRVRLVGEAAYVDAGVPCSHRWRGRIPISRSIRPG